MVQSLGLGLIGPHLAPHRLVDHGVEHNEERGDEVDGLDLFTVRVSTLC